MTSANPENDIRNKLMCDSCPAIELRTHEEIDRIEYRAGLMEKELAAIGKPELIFLCESFPHIDYIYDIQKPAGGGLRINLMHELYGDINEIDFINKLRENKIIVVHCAYCPIHVMGQGKIIEMRHATTICLKRHNLDIFKKFPLAPIITLFPHRRGFKTDEIPELAGRVIASFPFNCLEGLKSIVNDIIAKK